MRILKFCSDFITISFGLFVQNEIKYIFQLSDSITLNKVNIGVDSIIVPSKILLVINMPNSKQSINL